jgi:hypothetical protein
MNAKTAMQIEVARAAAIFAQYDDKAPEELLQKSLCFATILSSGLSASYVNLISHRLNSVKPLLLVHQFVGIATIATIPQTNQKPTDTIVVQ